jgi:cytochrome c oxidase assembly factor CtaG
VPVEAILGLALLGNSRPVAPIYSLSSTHAGGALLWIGAELFTFLALIPIFVQWMRAEERKAARYDAQLDAAMAATSGLGPMDAAAPELSLPVPVLPD